MTRTSGQSGKEGSMSDTPARPVSPGRDLPARASLEHLRNEAKAHLRTLRKKKTAAGLAEAQLDVARRYGFSSWRSEEHTSELQSQFHLVCRLLLEKKKTERELASNKVVDSNDC